MELIVIAIIVGLVLIGLERNKRNNPARASLAGSSDVQDRDQERFFSRA